MDVSELVELHNSNQKVLSVAIAERSEGQTQRVNAVWTQAKKIIDGTPEYQLYPLRGQAFEEMDVLYRTAQAANRGLTAEEQAEYDAAEFAYNVLDRALGGKLFVDPVEAPVTVASTGFDSPTYPYGFSGPERSNPVALTRSQSIADHVRSGFKVDPDSLSLDRFVQGMVSGRFSGAEAELVRAHAIAPDTAGGYLVPDELSSRLIDLARNATRIMQAGAVTVPMTSASLRIGRVSGDPTAVWHEESEQESFSDASFEAITLHTKTLMTLVEGSIEAFEDVDQADGLAGVLQTAMASALALELDRAALRGDGADSEPTGILNQDNVTLDPIAASLTNFDDFSTAVETIWAANGDPNAVIYSPRTAGTLDRLKDTTNQPLNPPASFSDLTKFVTKQIPENLGGGSDESEAYVADFRQLIVGMRTDIRLEISRVSESAFSKLQFQLRSYLRADVALAQPTHFVVITEIQP